MTKFAIAILTGAAVMLTASRDEAGTINAISGSYADVSNACATAIPGDTVVMPPGTNLWPQTLWLPAGISLLGSGPNLTTIICGLDSGGAGNICAIACNALSSNNITRISKFTLQGTNSVNNSDIGCIWMNVNSSSQAYHDGYAVPWRIDHIVFNGIPMANIKVYNVHSGLIDNCVFNITQWFPSQILRLTQSDNDSSGSYSWSVPYPYGGTNALYVEDCFFTNSAGYLCGLCDADGGGSLVLRSNMIYNCQYNNHGTEGTSVRAQRSYEIYGNIWVANDPSCFYNPAMLLRGGTGVIYNNTVTGWKFVETTFVKRVMQWCTTVGGADGLCPFDSNDPAIYLQGVWTDPAASATNNYTWLTSDITFSNISPWVPNQWAGYTVVNTNAPYFFTNDNQAPVYWFGTIVSNTSNTLSVVNPKNSYADQGPQIPNLTFQPGDVYQFRRVIHTLDQIGLGSGDYLTGSSSGWTLSDGTTADGTIPPLANEVSEPLYWWSNTLNGASADFDNSGFAIIQQNRDYFNDTPKPGYTKLGSHPLRGLGSSVATNSTVSKLAPPSNLAVGINTSNTAVSTSSSDSYLTNGLLAWYKFTEGSGTTMADSSGSGNTANLVGSPIWSTGPTGHGAVTFNGSGQYITVKSGAILGGLSAWSITCWVNLTGDNSLLPFYGESANNNGNDQIVLQTRGSWPYYPQIVYQNDGAVFNASAAGTTGAPGDGVWHFVAATFNGSTLTLYVDGVAEGTSQVWTSNNNFTDAGIESRIGSIHGSGLNLIGSEADVRLYSMALSATQVSSLYSAGAQ